MVGPVGITLKSVIFLTERGLHGMMRLIKKLSHSLICDKSRFSEWVRKNDSGFKGSRQILYSVFSAM